MEFEQDGKHRGMKRSISVVICLSLIFVTSPAQGFLNRDCSNLKKRTIANQAVYEKYWDKYQTALGEWQKITDSTKKFMNPEAVNRLRITFRQAEKILQDLNKYPKCLNATNFAKIPTELGNIKIAYKDLDGNMGFALYKNYLSIPVDYIRYLK